MSNAVDGYIKALDALNFQFKDEDGELTEFGVCDEQEKLLRLISELSRMNKDRYDLQSAFTEGIDAAVPLVIPHDDGRIDLLLVLYFSQEQHPDEESHGYVGIMTRDFLGKNIKEIFEMMNEAYIKISEDIIMEQLDLIQKVKQSPEPYRIVKSYEHYGFDLEPFCGSKI